jgi:hypothetical protein
MKSIITDGVDSTFVLLEDLVADVTFIKNSPTFSFGTGLTTDLRTEVIIPTVLLPSNKTSKEGSVNKKQALIKTSDIDDVTFYDLIKIGTQEFKIGELISRNDFVTKFYYYE